MVNSQGLCEAKDVTNKGNGERENKWKKKQKILIGRWFKLGYVPIFHFPVPHVTSYPQPAESLLVGKH